MARRSVLLPGVFLFVAASLSGQVGQLDFEFSIPTARAWTDTGLDLERGDVLEISASVDATSVPDRHTIPDARPCDPKGTSTPAASETGLPLASAPAGALIAKLRQPASEIILIGGGRELHIEEVGRLFLGVNIADTAACQGSFRVKVHKAAGAVSAPGALPIAAARSNPATAPSSTSSAQSADQTDAQLKARGEQLKAQLATAAQIFASGQFGTGKPAAEGAKSADAASGGTAGEAASAAAPLKVSNSPLDPELARSLDSIPRRVNDQLKNLGDMVNFVMVGSEKQVQAALEAANWHVADTDTQKAVLSAVLETYEKKDYLQMPMSTLYLFGRRQDFGYEQAEPIAMVASRHHFRIWKAPFTWKDREVWVGAGTHDIGFAKDQRNGSVTHKIDPAVDGERDNIGGSLEKSGKIQGLSYYLPSNPVHEAKNATGDSYHSDGRLLVIFLP